MLERSPGWDLLPTRNSRSRLANVLHYVWPKRGQTLSSVETNSRIKQAVSARPEHVLRKSLAGRIGDAGIWAEDVIGFHASEIVKLCRNTREQLTVRGEVFKHSDRFEFSGEVPTDLGLGGVDRVLS